jgi:hypothetical protein
MKDHDALTVTRAMINRVRYSNVPLTGKLGRHSYRLWEDETGSVLEPCQIKLVVGSVGYLVEQVGPDKFMLRRRDGKMVSSVKLKPDGNLEA